MTIIRVNHNRQNPYSMINNASLWDQNLPLEVVGLWARCMSKPNDWEFNVENLSKTCGVSAQTMNKYIKVLIANGYALMFQGKAAKGRFCPYEYMFFEIKITPEEAKGYHDEFKKRVPHTKLPYTVEPNTVNVELLSTKANLSGSYKKGANLSELKKEAASSPPGSPLSQSEKIKKDDTEAIEAFCKSNSINIKLETLRKWHHKWKPDRMTRNLCVLVARINGGEKIDSHEKWMEAALARNYATEEENIEMNKVWFLDKIATRFHHYKITKKYITFPQKQKEVYFSLTPEIFQETVVKIIQGH